jgi:ribosomal protein S18 acetylase RimI-like enzyme
VSRLARTSTVVHDAAVRTVQLRSFERDQLPLVQPWFADPETQRWLGGPEWPGLMLDLAERPLGEFRGAKETGRFRWVAWDGVDAVGYIDCGTFDRWTSWEDGPQGHGVVDSLAVPSAALTYVVDPHRRRRGYARAMLAGLAAQPEVAHVELFECGVEPDNVASVRALAGAGFGPIRDEPDFEGYVYFVWRRRTAGASRGPRD